jgi:thioredoxin reductase (NADPH)
MPEASLDCLIIGGGPAGLAAAVQLGRLRRSCLIVDDDAGRSLFSQVTRNHLGFPDGVTAANLRILGLRQADHYGAELQAGRVVDLERAAGDGFTATIEPIRDPTTDAEEMAEPGAKRNRVRERRAAAKLGETVTRRTTTLRARTVLVATGVVDEFPAFPDRDLCVGISLFWCIVCDGFESIGRSVTVVGDDEHAITTALGLTHFTDRVTLVTNRNRRRTATSSGVLAELQRRGVIVVRAPVGEYHHTDGQIERLVAEGRDIACEMVFVSAPKRARSGLARHLGAQVDPAGYLVTDDAGRTTIPGLYAAGDVTAGHSHQVTTSAHLGATAATAVNWDLYDPFEQSPLTTG